MAQYQYIIYKGREILYFDYRGLRGEPMLAQLKANTAHILQSPRNDFVTLSDFREAYADEASMEYLKSADVKQAALKTKKKAVLGISGLKKLFLNVYNSVTGVDSRAFDDEAAAKDYLVS